MLTTIYYISPRDVRKNRADTVSAIKTCAILAENGFKVNLTAPRFWRKEYKKKKSEIWQLYNQKPVFRITELQTFSWDEMPASLLRIQKLIAFSTYYVLLLLQGKLNRKTALFSRCYISIIPAIYLKKLGLIKSSIFFDVGVYLENKRSHRFVAQNMDGLIIYNKYITAKYLEHYKINPERIFQAPFPSQYLEFEPYLNTPMKELRSELGLNTNQKLVIYTGKVSPALKEIQYILEAAKLASPIPFLIVGCKEEFMPYFENNFKERLITNVTVRGFQSLDKIYKYIASADLLISYHDPQIIINRFQMVPAKSTVYICAGKPIIFADLPSLREWFDDDMIYYVPPEHPELLAEKIRYALNNPEISRQKAQKCQEFAKQNTYSRTYQSVSEFMQKIAATK